MPPHKATFISTVGGNDLYWRLEAPAKAVGAKTIIIPEEDADRQLLEPNDDGEFRWHLVDEPGVASYPDVEGTVVIPRPSGHLAVHADAMRFDGHTVVSEVDDNYIADPNLSLFLRTNGYTEEGQRVHLEAMASFDRTVFSTEWLRDHYWKKMKKTFKGKLLPEPLICRNNVDEADWPEPIPSDGPLRVTWMGSPSHVWDVDLAWPALMHAKHNLGCETWTIGYDPSNPARTIGLVMGLSEKAQFKQAQWAKVGAKHVPWTTPGDYHRSAIPADIGLCPLLRNEYTLGKSDVKFLEYTMSGAATVAQNNEVYNRTIVNGETGLLVGSPQEMLEAVDRLVKDDTLRETLIGNAQQYVREERGLKQLEAEWGVAVG